MANEPVGSAISSNVVSVLKQREELYGKNKKTIEDLQVLSANTAFAKLRSSVGKLIGDPDTLQASIDACNGVTLDNKIAENYILVAGTTSSNSSKMRSGVSFDTSQYNQDKAYNSFSNIGPRPMPGITNFSVKSKNTYGTLMEASIDFVIWSLQELNDMELVYFRPGYTALFEWGHSVYVDENGNMKKASTTAHCISDDFFFSRQSFDSVDNQIQIRRNTHKGNYEGMFGYITNFSWSFRADGGYDCNVKIVSRGVVLDNLKMAKPVNYIPAKEISDGEKEEGKVERKSIYHYIFNRLDKQNSKDQYKVIEELENRKAKKAASLLKQGISTVEGFNPDTQIYPDGDFYAFRIKAQLKGKGWLGMFDETINLQYIKLRDFFLIHNTFCTLQDPVNKQGTPEPIVDLEYGNKYSTYPEMISIDPLVCVTPTQPNEWGQITRSKLSKLMKNHVGDKTDDIMNIMVSNRFILSMVDAMVTGPDNESNKSMIDVMKDMLGGISSALNNIPDLDLHFDHHTSRYIVVDRNVFSAEDSVPIINVTGLKSTVKEIGIESTISKNVASQVAIAAQGNSGNASENLSALMEWNGGAIDRHMEIKRSEDNKADADTQEKLDKLLEDMEDVWKHFNGTGWFTDQYIDPEFIEQCRGDWAAYSNTQYKVHALKSGKPKKGVVPVELSLTMLGIGGFKIGQSFGINKGLLPSKYDTYAYIITGMEHTWQGGLWWTKLKTQFYAGRTPSNAGQGAAASKYQNTSRTGGAEGTVTQAYPGDEQIPPAPDCNDPSQKVYRRPSETGVKHDDNTSPRAKFRKDAAVRAHKKLYTGAKFIDARKSLGKSGMCARWTYNFAEYYVNELKGKGLLKTGDFTNAGGNANQSGFHSKLQRLGYTKVEVGKAISKSEVINFLSGYNFAYGDCVVYWANDGSGSHKQYGHAVYYMGDAHPEGGVWSSSVNYNYAKTGNGFIYNSRDSKCWNLLLFKVPNR